MEALRRFGRARFGASSAVYRHLSRFYSDAATLLTEGLTTWRRLRRMQTAPPSAPEPVTFSRLQYPFLLRPGTNDIQTAINNFVREEYGAFDLPTAPQFIVDAGAYTGDTSAYFLSRYPAVRVLALEPAAVSFALARRNLEPYGPRVELLQIALAGREGTVLLSGDQTAAQICAAKTRQSTNVQATTVTSVLARAPNARIDLLKMDIEGAEQDVFESGLERWAHRVTTIIVEPHGELIEQLMVDRMSRLGWHILRRRNLYCFGNPQSWS